VFCDRCRFDFYTLEGNPPCYGPAACEDGAGARAHVPNYISWMDTNATA
jgi:hypothetical protein